MAFYRLDITTTTRKNQSKLQYTWAHKGRGPTLGPNWLVAGPRRKRGGTQAPALSCVLSASGRSIASTTRRPQQVRRTVERCSPKDWLSQIATVRVRVGSPDPLRLEPQRWSRRGSSPDPLGRKLQRGSRLARIRRIRCSVNHNGRRAVGGGDLPGSERRWLRNLGVRGIVVLLLHYFPGKPVLTVRRTYARRPSLSVTGVGDLGFLVVAPDGSAPGLLSIATRRGCVSG